RLGRRVFLFMLASLSLAEVGVGPFGDDGVFDLIGVFDAGSEEVHYVFGFSEADSAAESVGFETLSVGAYEAVAEVAVAEHFFTAAEAGNRLKDVGMVLGRLVVGRQS